ncbi:transposase [Xanthomonas oryzae pv. oryzae]|nr:transposase [Xanthomonas oryzae pv. oryzae]OLG79190.1 transposase [Xanthomonas oryzae pv. oryzae]OLG85246.1 transposase [Xanthomonas oryzae pv. oryzae]OLG86031.1 transposase [Xanthomonas oryzae pv. oryzae]OLG94619.1 transposase [Xanthomonas oryzae pv. oryzae]
MSARCAQDALFGPSVQVAGAGIAAAGRPRLMASLLYLKHAYKLSDEELVERWAENVVWQHFSGMAFYEPRLPCDATQVGRFRAAIGEAGVEELLKATIDTAVSSLSLGAGVFQERILRLRQAQQQGGIVAIQGISGCERPWWDSQRPS